MCVPRPLDISSSMTELAAGTVGIAAVNSPCPPVRPVVSFHGMNASSKLLPRFSLRTLVMFMLLVTAMMATWRNSIAQWEYEIETQLHVDVGHCRVALAAVSPSSDRMLAVTREWDSQSRLQTKVGLWNLRTGRRIAAFDDPTGGSPEFPPTPGTIVRFLEVGDQTVALVAWSFWACDEQELQKPKLPPVSWWLAAYDVMSGEALAEAKVAGKSPLSRLPGDFLERGNRRPLEVGQLFTSQPGRPFLLPVGCDKEADADKMLLNQDKTVAILRRVLPPVWWRFVYRFEFYTAVAFSALLLWSFLRDRKHFKSLAAKQAEPVSPDSSSV